MVVGIFLVLMVTGLVIWWFLQSKPVDQDVLSKVKNIKQVNSKIIDNKTTQEIENREVIGNIPVEVEQNYNHSELFN